VSWLENDAGVALYEYVGDAPTSLAPHGNNRNAAGEYIRTNPAVLDGIRSELVKERRKPHDVYTHMVTDADSFAKPRDQKQVRNVAHKVGVRKGAIGTSNEADELQRIIGNIHENRFVKEVYHRRATAAHTIAYTDDQISDLKRFSAASTPCQLRSVIGVDRTFNLGELLLLFWRSFRGGLAPNLDCIQYFFHNGISVRRLLYTVIYIINSKFITFIIHQVC